MSAFAVWGTGTFGCSVTKNTSDATFTALDPSTAIHLNEERWDGLARARASWFGAQVGLTYSWQATGTLFGLFSNAGLGGITAPDGSGRPNEWMAEETEGAWRFDAQVGSDLASYDLGLWIIDVPEGL